VLRECWEGLGGYGSGFAKELHIPLEGVLSKNNALTKMKQRTAMLMRSASAQLITTFLTTGLVAAQSAHAGALSAADDVIRIARNDDTWVGIGQLARHSCKIAPWLREGPIFTENKNTGKANSGCGWEANANALAIILAVATLSAATARSMKSIIKR